MLQAITISLPQINFLYTTFPTEDSHWSSD